MREAVIICGEPDICNDENRQLRWVTRGELSKLSPAFVKDSEMPVEYG
jgi:hypothetical protein